jgi:hypothetical protein
MKDTKKNGTKIDGINDAVANDAAMWSRIAIDAASAAANAGKNDNNKDTGRIGKIINLETWGIFRPGTASYEAEKKKLLEYLAEQGIPEMPNEGPEISKPDEANNNYTNYQAERNKILEGYQAERDKIIAEYLAEHSSPSPEMQKMIEEISKQDEADKNDNKKKAKKAKRVHCAVCKKEWEYTGMEMNGPCKNLAGGGCETWLSWGPLPGEQADDENGKNADMNNDKNGNQKDDAARIAAGKKD